MQKAIFENIDSMDGLRSDRPKETIMTNFSAAKKGRRALI
jgi:hypothetical protein